jgi:Ca2+-binding RTX toxin-like protein
MRHRTRNSTPMRSLGIAAACVLTLLPADAFAATAHTQIKRVYYTAGASEANNLTISLTGADYALADSGAAITAAPACTSFGVTATCSAARIIGITVSAGDSADSIRNTTSTPSTLSGGDGNDSLEGGSGNDTLRGNKGVDTHAGGAGDDLIDVRGDRGDVVLCGEGNDTVMADGSDVLDPDCEMVDRGGAPPPDPGSTTGPPPPAEALLGPTEANALDRGACASSALGTTGNDLMAGTALGDNLFGLPGNDLLRGFKGDDCLFGGAGHDRLLGAPGDDRLLGDDARAGVPGNDRLLGAAGDDLLLGGPGRDLITGNAGRDRLSAGRGRNRLLGGAGNDRLNGLNGSVDRLNCGSGRDRALADGLDRLRGCEQVRRRG